VCHNLEQTLENVCSNETHVNRSFLYGAAAHAQDVSYEATGTVVSEEFLNEARSTSLVGRSETIKISVDMGAPFDPIVAVSLPL
jgi:hypothetical protein